MKSQSVGLSWRFLLRDWRAGELWLLVISMLVAVSISTAIALFSERLQLSLGRQVAEVLGADMTIRSPGPVQESLLLEAEKQGLARSTTLEFPSVVMAGDEMQLVSAKAVEENYPLRGHIRAAEQPFESDEIVDAVPFPGEVWLEPRLFPLLGVSIGDSIVLGEKELEISKAITLETDRGGSFYSLSPRVLFNMADVESTNIIQPGSRVSWKTLLAGPPVALNNFQNWAEGKLAASERLVAADDSRRDLRNSVVRLKQFLGLASIAAILLAGVAVAMASRRFVERRYDNTAVMRCLGAGRKQVFYLLTGELLLVALLVAVPGTILGWLIQTGIVSLLKDVLPAWLPEAGIVPMLVGGATGVITLAGFGLAPLLQLQKVSPLRVLRRELTPVPASSWLVYIFSLSAMVVLLWYHTGQLLITMGLAVSSALVLLVISLGLQGLLYRLGNHSKLLTLSLQWRLGIRRIVRQRSKTSAQLLAFSLTFMAMAIVLIIRTDLLDRWQSELPEDTPNYFALNIQPSEISDYRNFLSENQITTSDLYPIIRGRLTKINGVDVREAVSKDGEHHNSINRELNLTWAEQLPEGNELQSGSWWQEANQQVVSVETELAEHLGIALGDELTFVVSGNKITHKVSSIRSVQWESFRPNFYMVFPPDTIENLPATWLNSFYLPSRDKLVLNQLVREFPTMTLLDLDAVINQVRNMLEQSSIAIEAMLMALLVAGLLVMASVIESTIDERLQEGALIRSLGGTRKQLLTMQVGEFVLFGALSGLLAAAGAELSSYWLNVRIFELSWKPAFWLWLALPLTGVLLVGCFGWLGINRVIRQSPSIILKE